MTGGATAEPPPDGPAGADVAAWRAFRSALLARIRARGLDPADADDVVQTVITRLLARDAAAPSVERLPAWLGTVTRNAVADHWRRVGRARVREVALEGDDPPSGVAARADEPAAGDDDPLGRAAMLDCLAPLMAGLSQVDRTALWLADGLGRPQAEVAAHLGVGLSGAKSRIQRARRRLSDRLARCCAVERDARGRAQTLVPRDPCCVAGAAGSAATKV